MVSRIVCILTIVGLVSGAVYQGARLPEKPKKYADRQGCYVPEIDDVIPYGEMLAPIGACFRMECLGDNIEYATCGAVLAEPPNCFVTDTDLSRPYPHCCPTIKCEDDNYLV